MSLKKLKIQIEVNKKENIENLEDKKRLRFQKLNQKKQFLISFIQSLIIKLNMQK